MSNKERHIKKVLVTGGAGFIGSHLCPKLVRSGYQVCILDALSPQIHGQDEKQPNFIDEHHIKFVKGSILDQKLVRDLISDADAVVHLAAETGTGQSMYELARYNEINSQGTAILMEEIQASESVQKVVLASSRSVYGEGAYVNPALADSKRYYPVSRSYEDLSKELWEFTDHSTRSDLQYVATLETDKISPGSIYAATKFAQEHLVEIAAKASGIRYTMLRLQNVYGEGQSLKNPYTGILSIFSTKIRRNMELPVFEDGLETRDFVHVDDVANAFVTTLVADAKFDGVFNVGTGIGTTILQVAKLLRGAFNSDVPIDVTGQFRVGDIRHNKADISKITNKTDWTPQVDLREGLMRFSQWVVSQELPEDQVDNANRELIARNLMAR